MWLRLMSKQIVKTFKAAEWATSDIQEADSFGSLLYKNLNYVTHPQMYPVPPPFPNLPCLAKYFSNVNPDYFFLSLNFLEQAKLLATTISYKNSFSPNLDFKIKDIIYIPSLY